MSPDRVIQIWNATRNKKLFKRLLVEEGLKPVGCGERSLVFGNKSLDFIVKVSDGVVTRKFREPDLERFRLPYLYTNGNRQIAIQRKANRRTKASRYRAWSIIRDAVKTPLDTYDIHQDNVGWVDGKPVIFDYK
jgi:hypothetical protein